MVAENAMRLAWETRQDVDLLDGQEKSTSGRLADLEGRIVASLGRIEMRLGIVEKKPSRPEMLAVVTPSQRPISYHELPDAMAAALPQVEARANAAWWMHFAEGLQTVFREGIQKGAIGTIAAIIVAGALLVAGYFFRDCAHAVVKTGTSNEVPVLSTRNFCHAHKIL